jgi:lipoyl(octanoyl) transferase
MAAPLHVEWLGRIAWVEAMEAQRKRVEARRAGAGPDTLLLLEHPPVITLGRRTDPAHLLESRAALAARGIEVVEAARGGSVTYHGPGQLVGYLVIDLAARGAPDVHRFLRAIEADLIAALATLGVAARRVPGRTGVFAAGGDRPRKIASIGIGLRGWVSFHGFALNVTLDPRDFAPIVPCGLADIEMGSLARELGAGAPADLFERTRAAVAKACLARWDAP